MSRGRGMHQTEKAKDFKGTIKKLLRYVRPYYVPFFFVILFVGMGILNFHRRFCYGIHN